jgi:hypothetical protein
MKLTMGSKSLLLLSSLGVLAESTEQMYYKAKDKPKQGPVSTLSKPQKLKRKSKNTSAKKARKMNRK